MRFSLVATLLAYQWQFIWFKYHTKLQPKSSENRPKTMFSVGCSFRKKGGFQLRFRSQPSTALFSHPSTCAGVRRPFRTSPTYPVDDRYILLAPITW